MLRDVQLAPLPVTPVQEGEMAGLGTIVAAKGRLRKTVSASGEVDVAAGMEGRSPLMEAKRRLRRAETVVAYDGGKENVLVAEAMVPQWSEAQAKAWAKVKLRSSAAQAAVKREVEQYGDLAQWNCEQVALWFGKEFGEGVAQALIVKGVCGKDLPILTRDDLRTRLGLVGGDIAKVELGVARLLRVHQKGVL
ncbi:hypothetical protein BC830DRAFT_463594 [Chytriomyces sp. MP71]|nr:hypothetical protein BC830DRAFT_463594 [Chytriomyces sp. MP71]